MKVVKRKSDGEIVYRQEPEFETGKGIKSAVVLEGGKEEDYEEVDITQVGWDSHIAKEMIKRREAELNTMSPLIESIEESLSLPKGTIREKMKGKI